MPEDKKKFKPQNLSGLIHENSSTGSHQESRESSSPAPAARHAGTLTSAGGTYKLSAVKDSKGDSPVWKSEKQDSVSPSRHSTPPQAPKEPSPDGNKVDFNWVEEDDWTPDAISPALSKPADNSNSNANPWSAPKVSTSKLDLESQIKKLRTQPNSGSAKSSTRAGSNSNGGDGLTRFRISGDDPDLTPRDLMGASRMHGDMRRDESRSYGRFDHFSHDDSDMDWNSRRPTNSLRRGLVSVPYSRHDDELAPVAPSVSTVLRPLKSTITKRVPTGPEDEYTGTSSAGKGVTAGSGSGLNAQDILTHQKEEMQEARAKALEARLAKERQEEKEKQERIAARLAALDAKDSAKREQDMAERRKEEASQRQEQVRRESREREIARQAAERRHNEEIKERAMEESWSARKQAGGSQPLQTMRRKDKGSFREANTTPCSSEKEVSKGTSQSHITIKLPELGHMNPVESPENVIDNFPITSSWHHWQEPERLGKLRVVLPTL